MGFRLGGDLGVAQVRTAIMAGVRIQDHAVTPVERHTDAVPVPRDRREVEHHHHVGPAATAHEGEHRVLLVVPGQPRKARAVVIVLVQGRHIAVEPIEVAQQCLQAGARRLIRQMPGQGNIVIPLLHLPELGAHEEQFLARAGPLVGQQEAQVGELPPLVAGHLAKQRALAVHHFVVGERQHEVLAERVNGAEAQQVMMVAPMDGVLFHVLQRVVHPAHVPLEGEAQAAGVGGVRDHRPGSGLLGGGDGAGAFAVGEFVEALQERGGFEVLVAAVHVRLPFAVLARVVQVEHGSHGVHAQPVEVELLHPVQGA